MKISKIYLYAAVATGLLAFASCKDDDAKDPGNPVMEQVNIPTEVYFGDNLPFSVKASDSSVPLSTVKAELYIDDELIDTESVRTKVSGETYSGTVEVPYLPYAAGTRGKVRLVLQNINFTITETEVEFEIQYPDFPYLTVKADTGEEYRLERIAKNQYEATDAYPEEIRGLVLAPAYGENGRELSFGYRGENIEQGGTSMISFRNLAGGEYTISFNTYSYEFGPKGVLKFDDKEFSPITGSEYTSDFYFTSEQKIIADGFPGLSEWWIDEDFFILNSDGSLKFNAAEGYYRVNVNLDERIFKVKKIDEFGQLESLQADGSGTIWLMGTGVGKPNYANWEINWIVGNMLPFAPIGNHKYRMTFEAGKTLNATKFTLRIFDQPAWGATFTPARLTLNTDLLIMNVPGKEAHNIYLADGVSLETGATYEMLVDLSAGHDAGVLTLTKIR